MSYVSSDNLKVILTDTKNKIKNKINTIEVNKVKANKTISEETTIEEGYTQNEDIPYNFYSGSAVAIGTDIYLLGSNDSSYAKYNYKYDITTNTYTKNKDIPYNYFYSGSAVNIGNNIYLLGSSCYDTTNKTYSYAKYNYKYDTTTNTYTQNRYIPYIFYSGSAVAIGTDIYLLGNEYSGRHKYNYKYDITTDTYTKNKDIPYDFFYGSAVAIGTDIYLFGSEHYTSSLHPYAKYAYKYDITTDTYTHNRDIPYEFYLGSAVAIGNNIYLLGSGCYDTTNKTYSYAKYNYKYDTTTDTYTKNKDIPYEFYEGSAVAIGTDIYLLGSTYSSYKTNNYKYTPQHTETTSTTVECNGMIKLSNHSIYTESNSYTDTNASIIPIEDNNYTEYNGNNIVDNTFPIDQDGNTKMYIKSGAILNGKKVTCETEGWQDINLLDYM